MSKMCEIATQIGKRKVKGGIVVIGSKPVSCFKGLSTYVGTVLAEGWPEGSSERSFS